MPEMPERVRVEVLLFAQLEDKLGKSELKVALPAHATGQELKAVLARKMPGGEALLDACRLAVDQSYVSWDHPLGDGAQVAVIPPVSGG